MTRPGKANSWGGACDGFINIGPFSLVGDHDRFTISGEYAHVSAERDSEVRRRYPDTSPRMWGYYVQFQYRFFPEEWRDSFFFGKESSFGLTLRYETIDLDPRQRGFSNLDDQRACTLGFNFYPVSQTVFRIEYSWIRERIREWGWDNRLQASFATYF